MNKITTDRIVVVGAGVVGMATALELVRRGVDVVVLEAENDVALQSSFANGGLLTPSMADPWNGPGVFNHLASSLFNPGSQMKLRLGAIPSLFTWGFEFLRNSNSERHLNSTVQNCSLAVESLESMQRLFDHFSLDFDYDSFGTLKVFRDQKAMDASVRLISRLKPQGLRFDVLDPDGVVVNEPALSQVKGQLAGGVFFPDDRVGDARRFCVAANRELRNCGVEVVTSSRVKAVCTSAGAVSGVDVNGTFLNCRRVVLACGVFTDRLLSDMGLSVPVRPAKGYSLTIDGLTDTELPKRAVADDGMHAAVIPFADGRLRVAGTAEFAGFDTKVNPKRVRNLERLVKEIYPEIDISAERVNSTPWAGLRPMSSNGRPIIGTTPVKGLYVNCGHGHLGWTLAAGSAGLLADAILGDESTIDPRPFQFVR